MSKLWILRPAKGLPDTGDGNPWFGTYNMVWGLVVVADTEEAAREAAADKAGAEAIEPLTYKQRIVNPWQDETVSTCEPLVASEHEGVVMRDYRGR